ncbi:MAG: hypothetical protein EZS28_050772, partial [Streblomastix strix]
MAELKVIKVSEIYINVNLEELNQIQDQLNGKTLYSYYPLLIMEKIIAILEIYMKVKQQVDQIQVLMIAKVIFSYYPQYLMVELIVIQKVNKNAHLEEFEQMADYQKAKVYMNVRQKVDQIQVQITAKILFSYCCQQLMVIITILEVDTNVRQKFDQTQVQMILKVLFSYYYQFLIVDLNVIKLLEIYIIANLRDGSCVKDYLDVGHSIIKTFGLPFEDLMEDNLLISPPQDHLFSCGSFGVQETSFCPNSSVLGIFADS